ncbi:PIR Superfamily Protein [Plasmodium ovale wallikeri]|uniref:PIR Superfamily Protein n=1 Tax=Plasmodium ovale wallikeri TaxID=864142 RepID=A0A1A9A753_PLAOA|nr:PIR Superfamily Protein [Plasmodium ovale wallikeri]SBT57033.1 PIR Superfamily Protein [Plasmodium ovale wallikeri]
MYFKLSFAVTNEDLPADKFDDECIKHLNINALYNVSHDEDFSNQIHEWTKEFKSKFIKYYLQIWDSSTDKEFREKRCRDFNYWVKYIIDQVNKIVKTKPKASEYANQIKERAELILNDRNIYGCKLDIADTTEERYIKKQLDNFCENRDAFEKKLKNYNHKECEKYKNYIKMRKDAFIRFMASRTIKNNTYLHINEKCNFDKGCAIFPQIRCDSIRNEVIKEEQSSENELCVSSVKYPSFVSLQEGSPENTEDSFPVKKILSVSTPVAGAIAFSVVLYKFSPIGSFLNRGRNNFNPLQDGFDQQENQDFLGSPDFLNTNPDNNIYQIAYHTT